MPAATGPGPGSHSRAVLTRDLHRWLEGPPALPSFPTACDGPMLPLASSPERAGGGPGWLSLLLTPWWEQSTQPGLAVGGQARPCCLEVTPRPSVPVAYTCRPAGVWPALRMFESHCCPPACGRHPVRPTPQPLPCPPPPVCPPLSFEMCQDTLSSAQDLPQLPPHSGAHSPRDCPPPRALPSNHTQTVNPAWCSPTSLSTRTGAPPYPGAQEGWLREGSLGS